MKKAKKVPAATKAPRRAGGIENTQVILRHWREAVPNDRLAHLVKDATRALLRALQMRLAEHAVPFGHWTFLRILWENDGITQRELSEQAGVMEPTTFSALQAMEKLGYIVRRHMHGNKKKNFIFLTPRGRLLKEQAGALGRGREPNRRPHGEAGRYCHHPPNAADHPGKSRGR